MKFSILTATYNRAHYLERLYESIKDNSDDRYVIEWLIMDDGSTDNTENMCKNFKELENLKIRYFKQENKGKMQAINNLMKYVTGDFIIECDSDDFFIKDALKKMAEKSKILQETNNLYALVFRRKESPDKISGDIFFEENKDTTMFDLYFRNKNNGERIILYKSDIRKKYKYKLEGNERFCTEARMHHEMDLKYFVRCCNDIVVEGDYQQDGYTKNINKIFLENPKGYYYYFKEILNRDMSGVTFEKRLYVIKHYILFTYLAKQKNKLHDINDFFNKILYLILYVPGIIKTKFIFSK